MADVLENKLGFLREEEVPLVDLRKKYDLTTPSSSERVSFPYPEYTPALRVLDRESLASSLGIDPSLIEGLVSSPANVSSSTGGPCNITARIYSLSNSHAGSHADMPFHWMDDPPFDAFDIIQYNGPTVILDITKYLGDNKEITRGMLEEAAAELDFQKVTRLLLRTYHETPKNWDPQFAFLEPETARYLGSLPRLSLFGTDAPSVDRVDASPIHECSHGGLWAGRVAIIEGYNSDVLPITQLMRGVLQTTLIEIPGVKDSKQATLNFYST